MRWFERPIVGELTGWAITALVIFGMVVSLLQLFAWAGRHNLFGL